MTTTAVVVARPHPHVAQVAINRPAAKNAIDETTRLRLIEAIAEALADDTVRALLLCGTGGIFCAGGDLASMRGMSEEQARARMQSGHKLVQLLWNADIPIVVAMEKFAIGAGAGLALVADYIIAGETARMNFPFLNLGLVPDWGSTQSLVRKAGWGTARRLVLDRASLKGEQLLELNSSGTTRRRRQSYGARSQQSARIIPPAQAGPAPVQGDNEAVAPTYGIGTAGRGKPPDPLLSQRRVRGGPNSPAGKTATELS